MSVIRQPAHFDLMGVGELRNFRVQVLAADPGTVYNGRVWYNSIDNRYKLVEDGEVKTFATVEELSSGIEEQVTRVATAGGANRLMVSAGDNRVAKNYIGGTGIIKSDANGEVSAAVADTDYVTPTGVVTLEGKSISGANNTLTEIPFSAFAAATVSTNLATDASTEKVVRADAAKAYIDGRITAMGIFVGELDASSGNLPTTGSGEAGAIAKGDFWLVTTGGDITGVGVLESGDALFAAADDASSASDFFALQNNIVNAVSSNGAASTADTLPIYSDTSGQVLKPSSIAVEADGSVNIPSGASFKVDGTDISTSVSKTFSAAINDTTDWVGAEAPFTHTIAAATHELGAKADFVVQVRDSDNKVISVPAQTAANGNIVLSSLAKFAGRITIVG